MKEISDLMSRNEEEINHFTTEYQISEKKLSLCEKEINTFQQHVQNYEGIYMKLKNMYEKFCDNYKNFHQQLSAVKAKLVDRKKEISAWTNSVSSNISDAQNSLKIEKDLLKASKSERIKNKNENTCLEQQIKNERKCLKYLIEQNDLFDQRSNKLDLKIKENNEKSEILEEKKRCLMELKEKSNKKEAEEAELLQMKMSEKTER